jgi:hypothetical protein
MSTLRLYWTLIKGVWNLPPDKQRALQKCIRELWRKRRAMSAQD